MIELLILIAFLLGLGKLWSLIVKGLRLSAPPGKKWYLPTSALLGLAVGATVGIPSNGYPPAVLGCLLGGVVFGVIVWAVADGFDEDAVPEKRVK